MYSGIILVYDNPCEIVLLNDIATKCNEDVNDIRQTLWPHTIIHLITV